MQIGMITEEHILSMLSKGLRESNRGMLSYRDITLEIGTMPNAEGSATVRLGHTKVVAGIKIDIGEPMKDTPNEGNIVTGAELLPMASEKFDIGPPTPAAVEVARVIDRGIRASGMIDTSKLFVEEGKVWGVFIDVYVLNYDGNLFDAGTLASVAALRSSRMPRYEDGKVIREGGLGRLKAENISTSCTFAKIADKVLLDPDGSEESFMKARLTIANDEKYIRAMQKGLGGSFSLKEVDGLIDTTFEKSKELRGIISRAIGD